jgi:hypothetical protein
MALGIWFVNMSNALICIVCKIGMEDKTYEINKLIASQMLLFNFYAILIGITC